MVQELPILFRGEMIRAIKDKRKDMTRRIVDFTRCKQFINHSAWPYVKKLEDGTWMWSDAPDFHYPAEYMKDGVKCPYGKPGDQLWVRESWFADKQYDHLKPSLIPVNSLIGYNATDTRPDWAGVNRPSIFIPRWASRITLEITKIRVEHVRDITAEDVIKEGVQYPVTPDGHPLLQLTGKHPPCEYLPPGLLKDLHLTESQWIIAHFASLWDDINFNRGSWNSNPWVWVIEFIILAGINGSR